jgi:hypothetical protein
MGNYSAFLIQVSGLNAKLEAQGLTHIKYPKAVNSFIIFVLYVRHVLCQQPVSLPMKKYIPSQEY